MDPVKRGFLDEKEFCAKMEEFGFTGNAPKVSNFLLDDKGKRHLRLIDIDHDGMLESMRDYNAPNKKEAMLELMDEHRSMDVAAGDLNSLKQELIRQYTTLGRAWEKLGLGEWVSFVEFCGVLRTVGFKGKIKQVWLELVQDGYSRVTLADFKRSSPKKG